MSFCVHQLVSRSLSSVAEIVYAVHSPTSLSCPTNMSGRIQIMNLLIVLALLVNQVFPLALRSQMSSVCDSGGR
jgi:hypothetical protein